MIARLAVYILQQGYPPSQITILTMYSGQRNLIMDKLRRVAHDDARNIRVCTVDGFQGEENEIILLSLVRSNSNNSIGFLKTSNRVCVGLSRAKKVKQNNRAAFSRVAKWRLKVDVGINSLFSIFFK